MSKQLVFLCAASDFHAMDWYKSAKTFLKNYEVIILTDLIAGEGYKKLITRNDTLHRLLVIDKLLFRYQSRIGHSWRHFLKLLVFPIQLALIKKFSISYPNATYFAHSMYYLFLAWAAGVSYVGTPQGSDILIKPFKCPAYKYFTIKALKAAKAVTVDSIDMKMKIKELSNVDATIIQNGIDIQSIMYFSGVGKDRIGPREGILSIRGLSELYRIETILKSRNYSIRNGNTPITFIYPFYERQYLKKISPLFIDNDIDLKTVDRIKMYELLLSTKLVISIPISDSSPRSVYEAIFCGCAVAITNNPYFDLLPKCMRSRVIIVDLSDKNWFDTAVEKSDFIIRSRFVPSNEALRFFDQSESIKIVEKLF